MTLSKPRRYKASLRSAGWRKGRNDIYLDKNNENLPLKYTHPISASSCVYVYYRIFCSAVCSLSLLLHQFFFQDDEASEKNSNFRTITTSNQNNTKLIKHGSFRALTVKDRSMLQSVLCKLRNCTKFRTKQ